MAAPTMLKARWDFAGEQADDLPLKKGEIITLVSQHDSGWWKVRARAAQFTVLSSRARRLFLPRLASHHAVRVRVVTCHAYCRVGTLLAARETSRAITSNRSRRHLCPQGGRKSVSPWQRGWQSLGGCRTCVGVCGFGESSHGAACGRWGWGVGRGGFSRWSWRLERIASMQGPRRDCCDSTARAPRKRPPAHVLPHRTHHRDRQEVVHEALPRGVQPPCADAVFLPGPPIFRGSTCPRVEHQQATD